MRAPAAFAHGCAANAGFYCGYNISSEVEKGLGSRWFSSASRPTPGVNVSLHINDIARPMTARGLFAPMLRAGHPSRRSEGDASMFMHECVGMDAETNQNPPFASRRLMRRVASCYWTAAGGGTDS